MIRSTFYGFTTALSGLNVSQRALDVTGQNMANVFTPGYSRQRLDLYSAYPGHGDRYASRQSFPVGQGVGVTNLTQARDAFLDVRFRREAAKLGEVDANLGIKEDLEMLFDETQRKGLDSQIQDFIKQLNTYAANAGAPEFENLVKTSANAIAQLFNQYGKQINTIRQQEEFNFNNVTVPKATQLLSEIEKLSRSIEESQAFGRNSLELLDQRNMLVDELSTYMDIEVRYDVKEVSKGVSIEYMKIDLIGNTGRIPLLNKDGVAGFEAVANGGQTEIKFKGVDGTVNNNLSSEFTNGVFKGKLDALNKKGEFDTPPNSTKGLGYYEARLDLMVDTFAKAFNEANSIVGPPAENKPMFETMDGSTKFTATNIQIAKDWREGKYGLTNTKLTTPSGDKPNQTDNILKMATLFTDDFSFTTLGGGAGTPIFKGTMQEFFTDIGGTLALEIKSQTSTLENYVSVIDGISSLRDGVSSVSMDEEGVNLLRYQKSYNAAARLMTTLDEALETIINKMGTVGR